MYPYWLTFPDGWDYPASCATDSNSGGWAASIDLQRGISPDEFSSDKTVTSGDDTTVGSTCAGCVGHGAVY